MTPGQTKLAAALAVALLLLTAAYFRVQSTPNPRYDPREDEPIDSGELRARLQSPHQDTEVIGPHDAKVVIFGLLPLRMRCHERTIAALRQVAQEHPNDVRLTLADFFGPEAMLWRQELRVDCATVMINGKYTFQVDDRTVEFQKQEGLGYRIEDIKTVVEAELKKAG